MEYNIHDLVGKHCMTPEDGQKVYNLTYPELSAERPVELDFAGVDIFASHLSSNACHASICCYNCCSGDRLRSILDTQVAALVNQDQVRWSWRL